MLGSSLTGVAYDVKIVDKLMVSQRNFCFAGCDRAKSGGGCCSGRFVALLFLDFAPVLVEEVGF